MGGVLRVVGYGGFGLGSWDGCGGAGISGLGWLLRFSYMVMHKVVLVGLAGYGGCLLGGWMDMQGGYLSAWLFMEVFRWAAGWICRERALLGVVGYGGCCLDSWLDI